MLSDVVITTGGKVQGVPSRLPGVTAYLGIPYAASTAGANRWRPPQPVPHWEGVRLATEFGPACPQPPGVIGEAPTSEDCLNLNIWTVDGEPRRPVLVWVHGGRFLFGASSEPSYDAAALAAQGLVVVSLNYRLGAFGFLAHPELSAEGAGVGNYGLLDVLAALAWVQDNIAAFGGDPHRVTVAGQSCGGAIAAICALSPLARGMVHQVVVESALLYPRDPEIGPHASSHRWMCEAEADGVAWAAGRGASTLAELRALPSEALVAGMDEVDPRVAGHPGPPLFRPVIDGWVLPSSYWDALIGGEINDVAVIGGNNRDESGVLVNDVMTLREYQDFAVRTFGDQAAELLTLFPAHDDAGATAAYNDVLRNGMRVSSYLWAQLWRQHCGRPVRTYWWTHVPPSDALTPEYARGAYHGSEIDYFFNNLHSGRHPYTDADQPIADLMSGYLVRFVATGDPNGPGCPVWPVTTGAAQVMELGDQWAEQEVASSERLDFFARHYAGSPPW